MEYHRFITSCESRERQVLCRFLNLAGANAGRGRRVYKMLFVSTDFFPVKISKSKL